MEATHEKEPIDRWLFLVTFILLLLGVAIVLDASFARDYASKGTGHDAFFSFKRQAMWAAVALVTLAVGTNVPFWKLKRFWLIGVIISGILLVAVMIPGIGIEVNGSRRWVGFSLIRFQPSELAKIAIVIFLARYSELWKNKITHLTKGFIPPVIAVLGLGGLVAIEDLGTSITIIVTGLLMITVMGAKPKHLAGLFGLAFLGAVMLVAVQPYRIARITAWLDLLTHPFAVHQGNSYQPWQGLMAVGSGGVLGKGIGQGVVKHLYLPAEHTDYILATVGEEFGFLWGSLPLLLLFTVLVIRGLTVAHRSSDWFGGLVAFGLTCIVGIQAILNVAVVSAIVPCTGVPLPFISYGGSSLIFTTLAIGIILNVSQYPHRITGRTRKQKPEPETAPARPAPRGPRQHAYRNGH